MCSFDRKRTLHGELEPEILQKWRFQKFWSDEAGKKIFDIMYNSIAFCALVTNTQKLCRNLYSLSRFETSNSAYICIYMVAHITATKYNGQQSTLTEAGCYMPVECSNVVSCVHGVEAYGGGWSVSD